MTKKTYKEVSDCCNAELSIGGDDEDSTHYHYCMKCRKACNAWNMPATKANLKVSNSTPLKTYKLGDHFDDWRSLKPYEEDTILKKGTLAVLVADGREDLPLGTVVEIDEENDSNPYLLPKYPDGGRPVRHTYELAPLPTNLPTSGKRSIVSSTPAKRSKPTWRRTTILDRSDGIKLELDKITIDGKEYTLEEAHRLEVKLRSALKNWKSEPGFKN